MSEFQIVMLIISVIVFFAGVGMIFIDIYRPKKVEIKEEKDICDMDYVEFSTYIVQHNLIPYINYDDFEIYYLQGRYFYYGCDPWLDRNDFYEVLLIAHLLYTDDCKVCYGSALHGMFECDCCGEAVENHGVSYCWFKKAGEPDADTI